MSFQKMQFFRNFFFEFLETEKKYPWALMRRTCIPNFIPIGRWEKGEKSGEPKTGEKIVVLDAKYVDLKQS